MAVLIRKYVATDLSNLQRNARKFRCELENFGSMGVPPMAFLSDAHGRDTRASNTFSGYVRNLHQVARQY